MNQTSNVGLHQCLGCIMVFSFAASVAFGQTPKTVSESDEALAQVRLLEKTRRKEMSGWRPLLNSTFKPVRLAALRAVGQANVQKSLPILRTAAVDADPQVQDAALFSLLQLGELDSETLIRTVTMAGDALTKAKRIRLIGLLDTSGLDQAGLATLIEEVLGSKDEQVVVALLKALRQKAALNPEEAPLVSSSTLAKLLDSWESNARTNALHLLAEQRSSDASWKPLVGAFCQKVDGDRHKNLCLELRGALGTAGETLVIPEPTKSHWAAQVAIAKAYADAKDADGLTRQIEGHLTGLTEGSIALETPSFYGVIAPVSEALRMGKNKALLSASKKIFKAIQLEGVSVQGATGGLGLGLSHLHCAAAALHDRNVERVMFTKKCGASDYSKALRHMWMVRAVMQWRPKQRQRWFNRKYKTIEPRAQILALALAEASDRDLLDSLIRTALNSEVGAVAGSAAEIIGRKQIRGAESELVSAYRRTIAQREFSVVEAVITALARLSYDTAEELFSRHREDPHSGIREAAFLGLKAIEQKRLRESGIDRLETMQLAKRRFEPPPAEVLDRKRIDRGLITPPALTKFMARTTKGTFTLDLKPEWAFFASKKLVLLAKEGFFNGQGITLDQNGDIVVGDPSGLGWEGKGRNVPDEMSPVEIEAGYLILDRSGRDTGTSRLLITRQARPELFGRVNVVGRLLAQSDGLDGVVEGDRILSIHPHVKKSGK